MVGIFALLGMEKNQSKRMLWICFGTRRQRNGKIKRKRANKTRRSINAKTDKGNGRGR